MEVGGLLIATLKSWAMAGMAKPAATATAAPHLRANPVNLDILLSFMKKPVN
jgi:hypothetical protein